MILSILHLYNYNNKVFDKMVFPSGFSDSDKQVTKDSILTECAELEVIYPDYSFMRAMIETWSKLNLPEWERIYKAANMQYNPIENYNRTEIETVKDSHNETHSGQDKTASGGKDVRNTVGNNTESHSGSDTSTEQKTAYDSNTARVSQIDTYSHGESISSGGTGQDSTSYGRTDTYTHGEKIDHSGENTRENHTTGNIGVTTSQQMLEQEINITPALNVMKIIVKSFKERFCIEVY